MLRPQDPEKSGSGNGQLGEFEAHVPPSNDTRDSGNQLSFKAA
jgi:hypothetical protein